MSESEDGLMTPATRQNAGKFGIAFPCGGVKLPAGMDSARVIVVFGKASLLKLSQSPAANASPMQSRMPRQTNKTRPAHSQESANPYPHPQAPLFYWNNCSSPRNGTAPPFKLRLLKSRRLDADP